MNKTPIKIPKDIKDIMKKTIDSCNEQVDYQGWRYSTNVGIDEYDPFDINESSIQEAFWYGVQFLRENFGKKGSKETVSSYDLKHAFEKWWSINYPHATKIYMSNGIMLIAIVYANLAPDELWYSMDLSQYACINKQKWIKFCTNYDYNPKNDLEDE